MMDLSILVKMEGRKYSDRMKKAHLQRGFLRS